MQKIKEQKGITLMILVITVIVMIIITSTIAVNIGPTADVQKFNNMKNDIKAIGERVAIYYSRNKTIPKSTQFTDTSVLGSDKNPEDSGNYYVIALDQLENLTLNLGRGYFDMKNGKTSNDVYIINETTHTIYYVQGVTINGEISHR